MRHYLNDGSKDAPKLRVYLILDNLAELRADTIWPGLEGDERLAWLRADGFDGVQVTSGEPPSRGLMPFCGLERISTSAEALPVTLSGTSWIWSDEAGVKPPAMLRPVHASSAVRFR